MATGFSSAADAKQAQVDDLCKNFDAYLGAFNSEPLDSKMLSWHKRTMGLRKDLGGTAKSIESDGYMRSLYSTLDAFGMNKQAAKLKRYDIFAASVREYKRDIVALERVGVAQIDADVTRQLWRIIQGMELSWTKSQTVTGSKTLHHLLPQLLPPIDRRYTRRFFRYHSSQFQYNQEGAFKRMLSYFAQIAQEVDLGRYVGTAPWATSESKMIDNAIIGYCRLHPDILQKYQ